jgi:hypothetical protein
MVTVKAMVMAKAMAMWLRSIIAAMDDAMMQQG